MIKIDKKQKYESFFRKDELFDSKREKEYKVLIFGITLFKKSESFNCDVQSESQNGCGFKKT
jgi:hypothetical protein